MFSTAAYLIVFYLCVLFNLGVIITVKSVIQNIFKLNFAVKQAPSSAIKTI